MFLEGCTAAADPLDYFNTLTTTQVNCILSFILTRLPSSASLSCSFSHFAYLSSYKGYTLQDTFFSLTFIKERILCKKICNSVTNGRRYVSISGLLHFNSPYSNSKHIRLSAQPLFSLVSLCSNIRIKKKIVFSLS
jgi:hypothetical protein